MVNLGAARNDVPYANKALVNKTRSANQSMSELQNLLVWNFWGTINVGNYGSDF